jgi:CPA2 family monovalent cation:H+ antiporter-2
MHLAPLIVDLAMILAVAAIMSFVFQKIKQPVVLGYIVAGVIVGPHTPPIRLIKDIPGIQTWAELGIIFLMFTLGLEFSFRKLLSVGVTAVNAAVLEVLFFLIAGYAVGYFLGWSVMDSVFLGAMLSISSTTIIIKALDELKMKNHRFASLIFGILIVEDLIAILLLVALSAFAANADNFSVITLFETSIDLVLVVGGWFITGYFLVPRIMAYVGKKGNNEMLTVVSIALCLSLVVLATNFGYSSALGAFIMGSILAETEIIHRIEGLMEPMKDLFGAIFFVSIGMLIDPVIMWEYKGVIALLCFITIFGKIISTSTGSLISGQSYKNSMQVGLGLAQIGEFSFIIAGLGTSLKATSEKLYPIGVGVSLITTFTTPYLIKYSAPIAEKLESWLPTKAQVAFARYNNWSEHRRAAPKKDRDTFKLIFRWLANGIIVSLIFNINAKVLAPYFQFNDFAQNLSWVLTFVCASPFIWAMVFTSRKNYLRIRKERNLLKAILVLSFPVMTSIWIGILSSQYFPWEYVISIIGAILLLIYFFLYKRLELYYRWFEKSFLETFQEKKEKPQQMLTNLAPWDSHLVHIDVHPNAVLVNKSLLASGLRTRFGINVVAIQRGVQTIVAPKPHEIILPRDVLVVLGTDEQLDQARPELEIPDEIASAYPTSANYRLKHIKLPAHSSMVGKSIRESGFREKYHAMVVGIERNHNRFINPDTDMRMEANDIIWIVGEFKMLEALIAELT